VADAEEITAPDSAYDVVVGAQCFHWFDHARALPEIVRVLKPRGRLSLVWNLRDERIPWVRKLGKIIGTQEQLTDPTEVLDTSMKFIIIESETFTHWQGIDRRSVQDLVASRSNIAVLGEEARAAKMRELLEFYDGYGRGMDGMQLPYESRCFRARVVKRPTPEPAPAPDHAAGDDAGQAPTSPPRDDDDGTLLIDFR
jgi:SAM-dependent methyltransferase